MLILWHRFTGKSGKVSALSQLTDILQTFPEVFKLMISLGGRNTRMHLLTFTRCIRSLYTEIVPELEFDIISKLWLLLECHNAGIELRTYWLRSSDENDSEDSDPNLESYISHVTGIQVGLPIQVQLEVSAARGRSPASNSRPHDRLIAYRL